MEQSSKRAGALAIFVALCLMYVLSIGPVVALLMWLGISPHEPAVTCFRVFYAPIVYLHDQTALKGPLEVYVAYWEDLGRRYR